MRRVAAAFVVGLLSLLSPPATAHDGQGSLELLAADPTAPLRITYRVRLTFVSDGHPDSDATVTGVAERPGGAALTPQPMAPTGEEGTYAATVPFPEAAVWNVRFTAVSPPATLERAESVAAPPTRLSTSTTTAAPEESGGSGMPAALVGVGVVSLAAVVAAAVARRGRRVPRDTET